MKQVFISYAREDKATAEQLAQTLRKYHVASFIRPDAPIRTLEDALDQAATEADGIVFVLGAGSVSDAEQRREWHSILRSDLDEQKTMIPILLPHGALPSFLGYRVPIEMSGLATDYDRAAEQVLHYLNHPEDTRDEVKYEERKREFERRMEELKEWAHTL